MTPRILAPLAGILLLATYACAGNTTLATTVPAPNGSYIDILTNTLILRPQATAPVLCPDGKLYFDDIKKQVQLCNGGLLQSPGYWERDAATNTTFLKNINDSIIGRGTRSLANITLEGSVAVIGGAVNAPVSIPPGVGVTAFFVDFTKSGAISAGINGPFEDTLGDVGTASARFGGGTKAPGAYSFVSGAVNTVDVNSSFSAIVGGQGNNILSALYASIGGGQGNTATANSSVIGGGYGNSVSGPHAFIGGGEGNTIPAGTHGAIVGGNTNTVSGEAAFVGGGIGNLAEGPTSFVCGGAGNQATGESSTIAGGRGNLVSGRYSFAFGDGNEIPGEASGAFGVRNRVTGNGSTAFGQDLGVTADNTNAFSGVVAIGHYGVRPGVKLDVNGDVVIGAGTAAGYAARGPVPLYTVGAVVNSDGSTLQNYGVASVTQTARGMYDITFRPTPPFLNDPIVQVTPIGDTPLLSSITDLSPGSVTVRFSTPFGEDTDTKFSFSAMGNVSAPGAL